MGMPVVATPVACAGLMYEHGTSLLVADTDEAFAEQVVALLNDPECGRVSGPKDAASSRALRLGGIGVATAASCTGSTRTPQPRPAGRPAPPAPGNRRTPSSCRDSLYSCHDSNSAGTNGVFETRARRDGGDPGGHAVPGTGGHHPVRAGSCDRGGPYRDSGCAGRAVCPRAPQTDHPGVAPGRSRYPAHILDGGAAVPRAAGSGPAYRGGPGNTGAHRGRQQLSADMEGDHPACHIPVATPASDGPL